VQWIRKSPLLRERLLDKQKDMRLKDIKQLIQDNSTRWNSTCYSLQRAVELRGPFEMILGKELSSWHLACRKAEGNGEDLPPRPPYLVDYLSQNDWSTITDLIFIIKPLEQANKLS
jgi:hypothetical protein